MNFLKKFRKRKKQDRLAREIADHYGMTTEFEAARKGGLGPLEALEALEAWNLVPEEEKRRVDSEKRENDENSVSKLSLASLIVSILALILSAVTIMVSINSNNKTNKLTEQINSKEFEMSEDMKFDLIELIAALKSIVNKTSFYNHSGEIVEFSSELQILRQIQTRPGYLIFLYSLGKNADRIEIEDGVLFLTNYYLIAENISIDETNRCALKILYVLKDHSHIMRKMNVNYEKLFEELCSMDIYYRISRDDHMKRQITYYQDFIISQISNGNDDPDLQYYYYTFCEPNNELAIRAMDSGASTIDYSLSNDYVFWSWALWTDIEKKYHEEYEDFCKNR